MPHGVKHRRPTGLCVWCVCGEGESVSVDRGKGRGHKSCVRGVLLHGVKYRRQTCMCVCGWGGGSVSVDGKGRGAQELREGGVAARCDAQEAVRRVCGVCGKGDFCVSREGKGKEEERGHMSWRVWVVVGGLGLKARHDGKGEEERGQSVGASSHRLGVCVCVWTAG